jgi:hypothetical protein
VCAKKLGKIYEQKNWQWYLIVDGIITTLITETPACYEYQSPLRLWLVICRRTRQILTFLATVRGSPSTESAGAQDALIFKERIYVEVKQMIRLIRAAAWMCCLQRFADGCARAGRLSAAIPVCERHPRGFACACRRRTNRIARI